MRSYQRLGVIVVLAVVGLAGAGILLAPQGGGVPPDNDSVTAAGGTVRGSATALGIADLQRRVERVPGDWTAWANLARSRIEAARINGDPSQYRSAEEAINQSLKVHPDQNLDAWIAASALAAGRHDFAAALRTGRRAAEVAPESSEAYRRITDALIELGRYDEAEQALQRALDLRPGFAALARVSYLRELRGDVDGAVAAMTRAASIARSPSDRSFAAYHLGKLAFDRGDLDAAETHFSEAAEIAPQWAVPAAGMARLAAGRGDLAEAGQRWDAVLDRLPLPQYVAGAIDTAIAAGRDAEVNDLYELLDTERTLLRSADVTIDLEIARAEADRGEHPAEAVAAGRAAWDRRQSVLVADAYGWALHSAGNDSAALAYAQRAVRLGTRYAIFYFHLGMIQAGVGDVDEARQSLQTAVDINPAFSPRWGPIAEAKLAELAG